MPFFTRPNFEDRQQVQYEGTSITLSGNTNIYPTGQLIILSPTLDFTGTTTASTLYNISGLSGYINSGNISALKVQPPTLLISGSTGVTTVDVTGYYLGSIDSGGTITWVAPTGGGGSVFTGGTGSCITDLYVSNIHSCSPLNINPNDEGNVYFGSTSAVTIDLQNNRLGIGIVNPTQKLHVSGNTRVERDFDGDVSVIVNNTNVGGTAARGVLAASAIADSGGRVLNGVFAVYGYNSDTTFAGFSDSGTGYLKNALTITLGGNNPRGDFNIGTRNPGKFLRFFAGSQDFDNLTLRGSLNSDGYWGFGQNMTGQTATVHIKGYSGVYPLKIDSDSDSPIFYVTSGSSVGSYNNQTNSNYTSVIGGTGNTINTSEYSTILGGYNNLIVGLNDITGSTTSSTIIGGNNNIISNQSIYSGDINSVPASDRSSAINSGIIGGENNNIFGHKNSIILGGSNNAIHFDFPEVYNDGESIITSKNCGITASTYSSIISSSGSTLIYTNQSNILGGDHNKIQFANNSSILFGYNNIISDNTLYLTDNVHIYGGSNNQIANGVVNVGLFMAKNIYSSNGNNTVVLGVSNITANTANSVYVPDLIIKKSAPVPTTSGDTIGEVGSVTWDNNYIYIKTVSGWGRTLLDYSW
jgi:hypothetical protein